MKLSLTLVLCLQIIAHADIINISFHANDTTVSGFNTRPDGSVVSAGTNGSEYWNNFKSTGTNAQGLSFTNESILKGDGASSGATLSVTSGYAGTNSNGWISGSDDHVMYEGWYGIRSTENLVINNLPTAFTTEGYRVVIFGDSNSNSRTMNYTIDAVTKTIQDNGTFGGSIQEGVNQTSFSGLSGSSFTLTGNPGSGDTRSAICGIQIISNNHPQRPFIDSFSSSDYYLDPSDTNATVSWKCGGAPSSVTIKDQNENIVLSTTDIEGTTVITPSTTTTYTLTATNAAGSSTQNIRVGAGPSRPNIIFFLVDDMGWQDTSEPFLYDSSGNEVITALNQRYRTPNMEILADRGMKFTNAYAMPVCTPTRNCWITGQNSVRHHVTNWTSPSGGETGNNTTTTHNSPSNWERSGLSSTYLTLPSLLQSAGYRTIHAGKAHFGSSAYAREPLNIGFDVNIAGNQIGHPGSYTGTYGAGGSHAVPGLDEYHNTGTHLSEALTLEMNKAIEQSVNDGTPFFAYMAHYAVHAPFQADSRFTANYPTLTGGELAYATLIEGMDKSLGDIMAKLEQLGVAEDTIIVFMSDNGGDAPLGDVNNSNAPLRHKKGSKYEGGIREPFIVAWCNPDSENEHQQVTPIPLGAKEDDLIAVFDLYPTFAALAKTSVQNHVDGFDLTGYFKGDSGTHRPQQLLIHFPHDHRSDYFTIYRENEWKLIYNYASNNYELYNLIDDISESTDLSSSEPERVMEMARKMAISLNEAGAQWPTFESNNADDPFFMPILPGVDLDNDQLDDNAEDPNNNGLVDAGETNPDLIDSDGDGSDDGTEFKTGTDPLSAKSTFKARPILDQSTGHFTLSWPSKPGATYIIKSSTTLLEASWTTVQSNIPAHPTLSETIYDLGELISPTQFYKIEIE
ncbi:Arylsulfatase A [Rubritalea squalenifaciens DSM 18772]|uniref:Arylsulfatase A n=1 Tax=Rubritalea squalenifaciens DSM 18772 TaxID=1123071 RepID=A0A1M6I7X7_9BACT|nr:sulfatase [Rubritalea squalenifaciens]SHJ30577.1 Arylsulfatase A [Rubritalea squalenifaciens DSM 18772]